MPSPPSHDTVLTATHSGGTTATLSVTTAGANRLLYFIAEVGTTGSAVTLSIAGAGLTWTSRVPAVTNTGLAFGVLRVWTAVAPVALSGAVVTVTSSGTIDDAALICVPFFGQSAAGFDSNPSVPVTMTTGPSGGTISETINTSQGNDVVLAIAGSNATAQGLNFSPPGTFSTLASVINTGGAHFASIYVQAASFTGPQGGLVVTMTNTPAANENFSVVIDAITANSPGGQIIAWG